MTANLESVPYVHFMYGIPRNSYPEQIFDRYQELLRLIDPSILRGTSGTPAHNVVIVTEWILVIPRVHGRRGQAGANAAGMLGMIWVKNEEERDTWLDFGIVSHLQYLGSPNVHYLPGKGRV